MVYWSGVLSRHSNGIQYFDWQNPSNINILAKLTDFTETRLDKTPACSVERVDACFHAWRREVEDAERMHMEDLSADVDDWGGRSMDCMVVHHDLLSGDRAVRRSS